MSENIIESNVNCDPINQPYEDDDLYSYLYSRAQEELSKNDDKAATKKDEKVNTISEADWAKYWG